MRFGAMLEDQTSYPYVLLEDGPHILRRYAGQDVGALLSLDQRQLEQLAADFRHQGPDPGTPLPPLRPGKIVAIGLNYMDHVRETGMAAPSHPLVFAKFPSSIAANGQRIVVDRALTERVDWEVELAVIIGRGGRNIAASDADEHIFGYSVANDLSARDVQFEDGQWVRGKSLDGFCPLGPEVVTADELDDPQSLALRTAVNGSVVQNSNTSEMIFGIRELIEFCSRSFTLDMGDVILTGTPWGCGEFMSPPRSLQDGDIVEVSVERVGALSNTVTVV